MKGGRGPHQMHSSNVQTDTVSKHASHVVAKRFPEPLLVVLLFFVVVFAMGTNLIYVLQENHLFSVKGLMFVLNVMTSSLRS